MKKKTIIKSAAKAKTKKEIPDKKLPVKKKDTHKNSIEEIESKRNFKTGHWNEKDFKDDMSGSDLDVPGSELDDQQENIGSEDEENNYYSLGDDTLSDLDEDDD